MLRIDVLIIYFKKDSQEVEKSAPYKPQEEKQLSTKSLLAFSRDKSYISVQYTTILRKLGTWF